MTLCRDALAFWTGRENAADLVLLSDDAAVDTTSISRVVLRVDATTSLDSSTAPALFEWPVSLKTPRHLRTYLGATVKGLRLKLGGSGGLPAGDYERVWLIIYDPSYTSGLVWTDSLTLRVK